MSLTFKLSCLELVAVAEMVQFNGLRKSDRFYLSASCIDLINELWVLSCSSKTCQLDYLIVVSQLKALVFRWYREGHSTGRLHALSAV